MNADLKQRLLELLGRLAPMLVREHGYNLIQRLETEPTEPYEEMQLHLIGCRTRIDGAILHHYNGPGRESFLEHNKQRTALEMARGLAHMVRQEPIGVDTQMIIELNVLLPGPIKNPNGVDCYGSKVRVQKGPA